MSETQAPYTVPTIGEYAPQWSDFEGMDNPPRYLYAYWKARLAGNNEHTASLLSTGLVEGDLDYQAKLLLARLIAAGLLMQAPDMRMYDIFRAYPPQVVAKFVFIFRTISGGIVDMATDVAAQGIADYYCNACTATEVARLVR